MLANITNTVTQNSTLEEATHKMFSDEANYEEIMGLTHWMIFTDGYSIFAKDYVRDSKVFKILDDQDHITCLAVDGNKGYLFIAT